MSLFDDVKGVVSKYLGGQAERFIERQCKAHLNINPQDLTKGNLNDLAKWIGISAGLLLPKEKAEALKNEIISLS